MGKRDNSDPHDPVSNEEDTPVPTTSGASDAKHTSDPDARLSDLTLRELIAILRSEFVPRRESSSSWQRADADKPTVPEDLRQGEVEAAARWATAKEMVDVVGASPVDVQVCFLEGLVANPDEAERFLEDPAGYAKEAGVLLDPRLVREITDVVLFGGDLEERLGDKLSPGALRDVARIRERPNAGVISGAASTVSATASALFSNTEAVGADDLLRMKGLDGRGVRLPGGRILRTPRDIATLTVVANNAVAVYATTAVSSGAAVVASNRAGLAALRGARESNKATKPAKK